MSRWQPRKQTLQAMPVGLFKISLVSALLILIWVSPILAASNSAIVVGSKNFLENRLLAEMFAQLLEAQMSLTVERRFGLAGTHICFQALSTGDIDLYPEYTGTGLVTILGEPAMREPSAVLNRVRSEFRKRWNLWWLAPLGFENSYALALRRDRAQDLHIRTITDLVQAAPTLKAGFGYEFIQRADGLPGLKQLYGLQFHNVVGMQQSLKYQAAENGDVDVLDVYTTDGRLAVYDLVVLEDDRRFFPPYEATALVRGETLEQHPELSKVLGLLTNALSPQHMRELNLRIQEQGETIPKVAYDALRKLQLINETPLPSSQTIKTSTSFFSYMWNRREALLIRTGEHLGLAGIGLLLGIVVAIPFAFILERWRMGAETMIRLIGMSQTIPSIALLAFMIPLFGVGTLPAIMALWIYSLYPIVRNTFSGLRDASPFCSRNRSSAGYDRMANLTDHSPSLSSPNHHGRHSNSGDLDGGDRHPRSIYWSWRPRRTHCLRSAISRCACDSFGCLTRNCSGVDSRWPVRLD